MKRLITIIFLISIIHFGIAGCNSGSSGGGSSDGTVLRTEPVAPPTDLDGGGSDETDETGGSSGSGESDETEGTDGSGGTGESGAD